MNNPSLNFRFETKETRSLCENFIKAFKLKEFKEYSDISSLKDARWAITHEFSIKKGFPLWALKYSPSTTQDGIKVLIDDILKICEETDKQNPQLIIRALDNISTFQFEFNHLLSDDNSFKDGFIVYLKSVENVNMTDEEFNEAFDYLKSHLEGSIGLWTETEVANKLKNWRLEKNTPKEVEIEVIAKPFEGGEVYGQGKHKIGTTVNIAAYPNNGYVFKCWENLGETSNKITTTAEYNMTYCAVFEKIEGPVTAPPVIDNPSGDELSQKEIAISKIHSIEDLSLAKDILIKLLNSNNQQIIKLINDNM